jgi:hypothetical protein
MGRYLTCALEHGLCSPIHKCPQPRRPTAGPLLCALSEIGEWDFFNPKPGSNPRPEECCRHPPTTRLKDRWHNQSIAFEIRWTKQHFLFCKQKMVAQCSEKAWHTCHEDDITGTAPVLMASRNDCVNPARMGPVMVLAPSCFGLVRSSTNLVNASSPDLNSGQKLLNCRWGRSASIQFTPVPACNTILTS